MSDTFCVLPLPIIQANRPKMVTLSCCPNWDTIGNIKDTTFEKAWNSKAQQTLRKQLLNGERPRQLFPPMLET